MENNNFDPDRIGKFIAALRKSHNMTQEQLAEKLYITRKAVSKWETGRACPSIDILKKLSETFGVSLEDIIDGNFKKIEELQKNDTIIYKTIHNPKFKIGGLAVWIAAFFILAVFFIANFNSSKIYYITYENSDFSIDNGIIVLSNLKSYINLGKFYSNDDKNFRKEDYKFNLYLGKGNDEEFIIECEPDRMVDIPRKVNKLLKAALKSDSKNLFLKMSSLTNDEIYSLNVKILEQEDLEIGPRKDMIFLKQTLGLYKHGLPIEYEMKEEVSERKNFDDSEYIDLSFIYTLNEEELIKKYDGKKIIEGNEVYSMEVNSVENVLIIYNDENLISFSFDLKSVRVDDGKLFSLNKNFLLYLNSKNMNVSDYETVSKIVNVIKDI